jgi:hypothetical protein
MFFNHKMINEASVQEYHLEGDKWKHQSDAHKQTKPQQQLRKGKNKKWNEKNIVVAT